MRRTALTVAFLMPLVATVAIGVRTSHAFDGEVTECQEKFAPGTTPSTTTFECTVQTIGSGGLVGYCATVETLSGEIFFYK